MPSKSQAPLASAPAEVTASPAVGAPDLTGGVGNSASLAGVEAPAEEGSILDGVEASVSPPNAKPPAALKAGILDQAGALAVLTGAFSGVKMLSGGKMDVLAQTDFELAYDAVYGATTYSWAAYVVPTFGNLEGFAHDGTNYINADMASADTAPHEMLHNNCAGDFAATMGDEFDEGTTEYMTIYAMNKAGLTPSHSYPNQEAVVQAVVAAGVSEQALFAAYLNGGAKSKIYDVIEATCAGPAADFVTDMEASLWASAKARLAKKTP